MERHGCGAERSDLRDQIHLHPAAGPRQPDRRRPADARDLRSRHPRDLSVSRHGSGRERLSALILRRAPFGFGFSPLDKILGPIERGVLCVELQSRCPSRPGRSPCAPSPASPLTPERAAGGNGSRNRHARVERRLLRERDHLRHADPHRFRRGPVVAR